jgi:CheY-like chemotaxis protein
VLFLDLNMPRKNGFECLTEIKQNVKLRQLPVIIFSTSFEPQIVDLVYNKGATYYVCKPNEYPKLVSVIHYAITVVTQPLTGEGELYQPPMKDFVLLPETCYNESKKG